MTIELRRFASLRKHLPPGSPRGKCSLDLPDGATVGAVWAQVHSPLANAHMINGEHDREVERALADGDVLSVFPPVAGG